MEPYSKTRIKNLFLRQSYMEAWQDYEHSIAREEGWDYVILTASNEAQAKAYRLEIDYRLQKKMLPEKCSYMILPDPEGKRVGSGGATFHVLRKLAEENGGIVKNCLKDKKVLVIHSGGDSKRIPQYSVCGKLFSPVPRELPNGEPSTLFDEFMIVMSAVADRMKEGMLVLSGDVLLLFNSLQLDFQFKGAAAISMKEHVSTGKDHGVFLRNSQGMVERFLHKLSEEQLREMGAVNEQGNVDLDTGAVLFDCELLDALLSLISTEGSIDEVKYSRFVNEQARISFYGDFLYPLAEKATLEDFYEQAPEGSFCEELKQCRELIWEAISGFSMKVICLSPAEFIHFGTTRELLSLVTEKIEDYEFLDWKRCICSNGKQQGYASHNSFISEACRIGKNCYLEDSLIGREVEIGSGSILSQIEIQKGCIPENTVMHMVTLADGKFVVRIYGVEDNPKGVYEKNTSFLNGWLKDMLDFYQIPAERIWKDTAHYLWFADLYPVCTSKQEAVERSLLLTRMAVGDAAAEEVQEWLEGERTSLYESFNLADVEAVLPWKRELLNKIRVNIFIRHLSDGMYYQEALQIFGKEIPKEVQLMLVEIGRAHV